MPLHTAVATIHTNYGDIVVNLFGDHAPRTVQNFIGLSDGSGSWTNPATGKPGEGPLYKDVIFHRIISGFMIQGGDPLGQGVGGPGYNFNDEIIGDVADDASKAVVDTIAEVPTAAGDRPVEPVVIESIDIAAV